MRSWRLVQAYRATTAFAHVKEGLEATEDEEALQIVSVYIH
jgi:hypothetical protein